jgi:BirA family biotin operon repressor/biotin-[acetyl-CoA-carboxylase] ligase
MVSAMSRTGFSDVRRFDTIDSTNRYLLDEARAGAPEGVVALADHQSAGRGRLGRTWEAPPGASLLVSVLLRPGLPATQLFLCTVLTALAGADACAELAGVRPELKWPNDLLVGDKKLAGILAESAPAPPGGPAAPAAVVVGMGVNIDWPGPPGAGGTSLREASGRTVDRLELLSALLDNLDRRRGELDTEQDRAALLAEFRARCATLGRAVRVTLAAESLAGTAVAITEAGHLVIESQGGRRAVAAGDVVHVRPAEEDEALG